LNIWKIQFSIVEYLKDYSEINIENSKFESSLHNFTSRQIQMLGVVRQYSDEKKQGISLLQLANLMSIKSPAASTMVNYLVNIGFLERDIYDQDRREVRIVLSSKMCKQFELYDEILNKKVEKVVNKMGNKKATMLQGLLEEMESLLKIE